MTRLAEPAAAPVVRYAATTLPRVETGARAAAGIGVALAADVHFDLWSSDGFRDIPTIGPLFLMNAVGGLAIAFAVIGWRHWLTALAAVGFGLSTLAAFWWSVTWGLFGVQETATGQPQVLAEVAEIVAVAGGIVAVVCGWARHRHRTR